MVAVRYGLWGVPCVSDQGEQARGSAPLRPRRREPFAHVLRGECALAVTSCVGMGERRLAPMPWARSRPPRAVVPAPSPTGPRVPRERDGAAAVPTGVEVLPPDARGERGEGSSDYALSYYRG